MSFELIANNYGKSRVRLSKVTRHPNGRHDLKELAVEILLTGDFAQTYLTGEFPPDPDFPGLVNPTLLGEVGWTSLKRGNWVCPGQALAACCAPAPKASTAMSVFVLAT